MEYIISLGIIILKKNSSLLAKEWKLKSKKGGDISEFPKQYQIREFPKV